MDSPTPPPLWGDHPTTDGEARATDAEAVHAAAAAHGMTIPDACLPGVTMNLALLARHAAALDAP